MLTEALRRARRALMRSFSSAVRAASETNGEAPFVGFLRSVRRCEWMQHTVETHSLCEEPSADAVSAVLESSPLCRASSYAR